MANTNTPYIAKNAAPLVNPTGTAQPFLINPNPALSAFTQTPRPLYVKYATYAQGGSGTSNNINYVKIAVRFGGRVSAGASTTFTPSIAVAAAGMTPPTTASLASGTQVLGTLTPATYTATPGGVFTLDATLVWAYDSGVISGTVSGNQTPAGGTPVVTAATAVTPATGYTITPPLTALPTSQAQALAQINNGGELPLFFVAYGLFGTSNAANTAFLDDFEVETL